MCKHCVPAWEGQDIMKTQTLQTVLEVAGKISEISEAHSKNSESAPSDASPSA